MATSGSVDYTPTAATIITQALRVLGALEEGVPATNDQINDVMPTFEMMIKAFQSHGMPLWKITSESVTLVASTGSYTLPAAGGKVLKITDAQYKDSNGNETPLIALTRNEYKNLNDKTTESNQVTQYYFDPQLTTSTIYLWPVPDTTGATGTLEVTYQDTIEDIDNSANDLDFPQEWYEALTYNLAYRLCPMYGYPYELRILLEKDAEKALDLALSWDTEQESVYFRPDYIKSVI